MKGFNRDIQKAVGGVDKEFDKAGKSSGGFFSRALSTAAGIGIAKAGAAVGGLFSSAVGKGMGRLEAIDTARGKLAGLGKDAVEVDAIMESALASVKGTAYGLGDAATVAASTVAAGVRPGQDLERTLKLVGDAATIGGTSMGEMGAIFNKVAASNKIQMGEMNQLMDRGIPVQQMLADHLGVSVEEVQKLASAGRIGFADFQAAMEKGLGGAALKSGETFRGSLENVGAAVGRLGALALGPVFAQLPALFGNAIGVLDGFAPVAERVGEAIGAAFTVAVESVKAFVTGLQDVFSRLRDGGSALSGFLERVRDGFSAAVGGAKSFFGGFIEGFGGVEAVLSTFTGLLPLVTGPLGILKSALAEVFGSGGVSVDMKAFGASVGGIIGPLATGFAELAGTVSGALAQAFAQVLPVLLEAGKVIGSALGGALTALMPVIAKLAQDLLPVLSGLFASLVPVVANLASALIPVIGALISQFVPVVAEIISALLPPLSMLLKAVVGVLGTLVAALVPVITALVQQLAPIVSSLVSALLPPLARVFAMVAEVISTVVAPVLKVLINVLGVVLVGALNALMPIVRTVFDFIARTIGNAMDVISGIIRLVMAVIRGDWDGAWNAIKQIGAAVWDQIKAVIETAINLVLTIIRGVLTAIQAAWSAAWEVIKAVLGGVWDWIKSTVTAAINAVMTIITTVMTLIRTAWSTAWDLIKSVAGAAWEWLKTTIQAAITAVRDTIDRILTRIRTIWDTGWNRIKDIGKRAWDWITARIEDLKSGVERIFQRMVDGVGRIWSGIQEAAARPVRFVIDTVINNGIIKGWNDLVGLLKLDSLKVGRINVPGFTQGGAGGRASTGRGLVPMQTGGIVPGRFDPRNRDNVLAVNRHGIPIARVEPGEAVIPRDQTRKHWGLVQRLIHGDPLHPPLSGLPGFWMGGVLPTTAGRVSPHRLPYYGASWAGDLARPFGAPVFAWKSGTVASTARWGHSYGHHIRVNHGSQNSLYAHLSRIAVIAGEAVRQGQQIGAVGSTGNSTGPHLHFEIRGGLAGMSAAGAADDGPFLFEQALGWIKDKITGPVDRVLANIPGSGMFAEMAKSVGKKLADLATEEIKKRIPGMLTGGRMPWTGPAFLSEDGRPELVVGPQAGMLRAGSRVFDAEQTAAIMRGGTVNLTVNNPLAEPTSDSIMAASGVIGWGLGA